MTDKPDTTARQIVALLIVRHREARRRVREATRDKLDADFVALLVAHLTEAQNAAELARRVLYHGPKAL